MAQSHYRVTDAVRALAAARALGCHSGSLRAETCGRELADSSLDGQPRRRPAEEERIRQHQLLVAAEEQLPERRTVLLLGPVGGGGIDRPDLVVDRQQHQVDAGEVPLVEAAGRAAIVAADEDPALELIAPYRVRRGELAGLR